MLLTVVNIVCLVLTLAALTWSAFPNVKRLRQRVILAPLLVLLIVFILVRTTNDIIGVRCCLSMTNPTLPLRANLAIVLVSWLRQGRTDRLPGARARAKVGVTGTISFS